LAHVPGGEPDRGGCEARDRGVGGRGERGRGADVRPALDAGPDGPDHPLRARALTGAPPPMDYGLHRGRPDTHPREPEVIMQAQVGDIRMHWREVGAGDVVLFVHGFPFDSGMWAEQLDRIPRRFRLIAPDLRGFGSSTRGEAPVSMDRFADDLVGLLDHLGIDRTVVCGLSMGGYVAFALWRRHPDRIRALVLCATRAGADTEEARRARFELAGRVREGGSRVAADEQVPRLLSERTFRDRPEVADRVREMIESTDRATIVAALEAMAARPDSTPLLAGISVPTLVVAGGDDRVVKAEEMRRMADAIPEARFQTIPEAGHLPPLECPAEFNLALVHFLEAIQGH